MEDIRNNLTTAQVTTANLAQVGDTIVVTVGDPTQMDAADKVVTDAECEAGPGSDTRSRPHCRPAPAPTRSVATYRPEALQAETVDAVERSKDILRRRIDPDGTKGNHHHQRGNGSYRSSGARAIPIQISSRKWSAIPRTLPSSWSMIQCPFRTRKVAFCRLDR